MNRIVFPLIFIFGISISTQSQNFNDQTTKTDSSPYKTSWAVDGTYLGVSIGLNVLGFKLIQEKDALTIEEMNNLSKEDVLRIDRFIAGNYNESVDEFSYYPFYGSFAVPVVMMLGDSKLRPHAGQISIMFVESMATTGALFTITAGLVDRPRPLAYNTSAPEDLRRESGAQRAFFAGHTAATASATFFAAKIYNDFYPNSALKPYVWTAAAAIPAWMAYLRSKSGKHFLTDNIVGYAVGAASGILIPEFHKIEDSDIKMSPTMGVDIRGNEYKGLSFEYSF